MGKRIIFCQKEDKQISSIDGVDRDENVYPAFIIKNQIPVDEKYRFSNRRLMDLAQNKCPHCGGNLLFQYIPQ